MFLSHAIYKSELAQDAILSVINAKGRKIKGLTSKIQVACNSLEAQDAQELWKLCKRIELSFNYRKVRLKAVHNQRNNDEDARKARVWNFIEQNPNHPLITDTSVKKLNYWER
jgi:hypothetical protein